MPGGVTQGSGLALQGGGTQAVPPRWSR
jgi:hypothetical protein